MTRPPRLAEWLAGLSLTAADHDAVLGDLAEEFEERARADGEDAATRWYWRQLRRSLLPNIRRRLWPPSSLPSAQRGPFMNAVLQDIRYAWRSLRNRPAMTLVAVSSLVVGLAASTLVFSLLDAAVFRPLPIAQPDHVKLILEQRERNVNHNFRYIDYVNLRSELGSMMDVVALSRVEATLSMNNQSQRLSGEIVTGAYFTMLGVRPAQGRALTIADDDRANPPVAVVGDGLWTRLFGKGTRLSGQTVTINRVNFAIVGVADAKFRGMQVGRNAEFWAPLRYQVVLAPRNGRDLLTITTSSWLTLVGRVQAGLNPGAVETAINQIEARQPRPQNANARRFFLGAGRQGDSSLPKTMASPLQMLLAAAMLVLVVACANVTNLLLARATDRTRELSLRAALGAGRARLTRMLVVESLVLSSIATVIALVVTHLVAGMLVPYLASFGEAPSLDVAMNLRVLGFGAALAAAVTLATGLIPALAMSPAVLSRAIADSGRGASASPARARLRRALVALQFALSLALVVASALLMRTVINLRTLPLGFDIDRLAILSTDPESAAYREDRLEQYMAAATARLAALPGVESVAIARVQPLDFGGSRTTVTIPGYTGRADEDMELNFNTVSPGYFRTLGIKLLTGRAFDDGDRIGRPGVAIVNATMAAQFWPGRSAVGERISVEENVYIEVIGVVADAKYRMLRESAGPSFYVARAQNPPRAGVFHVRTAGAPDAMLPTLREALARVDGAVPVTRARTLREQASINMTDERLAMTIAIALGGAALLLATVGLFGAMSYNVAHRLREIGVRMALGAEAGTIQRMVLVQGLGIAAAGSVLGLALAFWATRLIEARLFGVTAADPTSFAVSALLLAFLALIATWIPARRATRVNPVDALRVDQ